MFYCYDAYMYTYELPVAEQTEDVVAQGDTDQVNTYKIRKYIHTIDSSKKAQRVNNYIKTTQQANESNQLIHIN